MAPGINPDFRYCSQCGQPAPVEQLARFGDSLICPNCKNSYVQKLREGVAPLQSAFQYAGFWIRFVAAMIDGIILATVGGVVQLLLLRNAFVPLTRLGPDTTPDQMLAALGPLFGLLGLATGINMLVGASYEAFFVNRLGATPGKMVLSLKVVRSNGGPVSLGRAFGRYFAKILSSMVFMIGYIIAGFDAQKRAMHDMICDTRVIVANRNAAPVYPQV